VTQNRQVGGLLLAGGVVLAIFLSAWGLDRYNRREPETHGLVPTHLDLKIFEAKRDFDLARLEENRGNARAALLLDEKAVEADPLNAEYLRALAAAYEAAGRHEESLQQLKALTQGNKIWRAGTGEFMSSGPAPASFLGDIARNYLALSRYSEALASANQYLAWAAKQPRTDDSLTEETLASGYFYRGKALMGLRRLDEAQKAVLECRRILGSLPETPYESRESWRRSASFQARDLTAEIEAARRTAGR
jgi:tetratricopeptide (TPR) repeat protein